MDRGREPAGHIDLSEQLATPGPQRRLADRVHLHNPGPRTLRLWVGVSPRGPPRQLPSQRRHPGPPPSRWNDHRSDHIPGLRRERAVVGPIQGSCKRRTHGHEQRRGRLLHLDPALTRTRERSASPDDRRGEDRQPRGGSAGRSDHLHPLLQQHEHGEREDAMDQRHPPERNGVFLLERALQLRLRTDLRLDLPECRARRSLLHADGSGDGCRGGRTGPRKHRHGGLRGHPPTTVAGEHRMGQHDRSPAHDHGRTFYLNFTNVAPGPHSLTMTARVNAGFAGSQLVNWAFLNYTTVGGFVLNGGSSSAVVAIPELSDMIYVALVPLVIVGLKWRAQRREKE